jgi:hypothetical protein
MTGGVAVGSVMTSSMFGTYERQIQPR